MTPTPPGGWRYGSASPRRLARADWLDFAGMTAHGAVTGQAHWDTGVLDLERISNYARELLEDEMILQKGDFGWAVKRLQQGLMAWNSKALPEFGADKDYGAEMEHWVGVFQKGQNLVDAQNWDPALLGKIDGITAAAILRFNPHAPGDHQHHYEGTTT